MAAGRAPFPTLTLANRWEALRRLEPYLAAAGLKLGEEADLCGFKAVRVGGDDAPAALVVLHPLEARPSDKVEDEAAARLGASLVTATTFDLEVDPFRVFRAVEEKLRRWYSGA